MSSLINFILNNLKSEDISSLSKNIGANSEQTKSAIEQALPLLIASLSGKNSQSSSGWSLLSSFLDKNNDGSIMDDLIGMALGTGANQQTNQNALSQILGTSQENVEAKVSQSSGLDASSVAKLLPLLAPIVIGALAKAQKSGNLDQEGVKSLLEVEKERIQESNPDTLSFVESMLDSNKDGSVTDDLMKMGSGLLGKFLKN